MKKILKKYKNLEDVYCRLNILVGFPGEDQASFNETLDFVNSNAMDDNIQISPTLFSNYPNVFVYKNMDYFENKFGSIFIKNWWKIPSNPFKNSIPEMPSSTYYKKDLINDYKENYFWILRQFKKSSFHDLIIWKDFFNKWYREYTE